MNKNKYELIIFDCDGTLVDSELLINQVCSEILQEMGYTRYTVEFCMRNFSGISSQGVDELLRMDIGSQFDGVAFLEQAMERTQIRMDNLKSISNAEAVLQKLQDIKKCVASNGERDCVVKSLKVTNLYQYFRKEDIFTYELVGVGKPEPDLFLYAAKKMGASPEKCLVIEDTDVGAKAAKLAGMDVLVLRNSVEEKMRKIEALNPTAIIDNLMDILRYL